MISDEDFAKYELFSHGTFFVHCYVGQCMYYLALTKSLEDWVIDSMTGDLGLMSYVDKITILPHITFLMGLLLVLVVMA